MLQYFFRTVANQIKLLKIKANRFTNCLPKGLSCSTSNIWAQTAITAHLQSGVNSI